MAFQTRFYLRTTQKRRVSSASKGRILVWPLTETLIGVSSLMRKAPLCREYVIGFLAAAYLAKEPGAKVVHDPRYLEHD